MYRSDEGCGKCVAIVNMSMCSMCDGYEHVDVANVSVL